MHKKVYSTDFIDSKFYKKDFLVTQIEEIEFIRSPFYQYAEMNKMNAEDAHEMLDELSLSQEMVDETTNVFLSPFPTKENAAFFRY